MAILVLVRHGTSEYNEKGIWAGWDDPKLTSLGEKEAADAAETLKDIHFDFGYTSPLIRHKKTLEIILNKLQISNLPVTITKELKERNYGDFTGKNKWEVKKMLGEEEFLNLRRGWNYPVPNGESLKQVYNRVVPFFKQTIFPQLQSGENIIVSSSGNTLRSVVKYLENISDSDIANLEIAPGEVLMYTVNSDGKITNREIRNKHENNV